MAAGPRDIPLCSLGVRRPDIATRRAALCGSSTHRLSLSILHLDEALEESNAVLSPSVPYSILSKDVDMDICIKEKKIAYPG